MSIETKLERTSPILMLRVYIDAVEKNALSRPDYNGIKTHSMIGLYGHINTQTG